MALLLPIEGALGRAAIVAIRGYQNYVSPYKGFVCAHRARHGGLSCSEFAREAIAGEGLRAGLRALRSRLAECREAAGLIREDRARRKSLAAHREFDDAFDPPTKKSELEALPTMSPDESTVAAERQERSAACDDSSCLGPDFYCPGVPLDCCGPALDQMGCDLPMADCAGCDLPVDCCAGF